MRPETEKRYRAATEAKYGPMTDEEWNIARIIYEAKRRARRLINEAVQKGIIEREGCEQCGARAHAHHPNYARPLAVIWLCPIHHRREHDRLARLETESFYAENRAAEERARLLIESNLDRTQVRNFFAAFPIEKLLA